MKHDYTALDSAIKAALATGPKKFRELEEDQEIKRQSIKIAAAHNASVNRPWLEVKPWRILDIRQEAMCKSGEIEFGGGAVGWSLKGEA